MLLRLKDLKTLLCQHQKFCICKSCTTLCPTNDGPWSIKEKIYPFTDTWMLLFTRVKVLSVPQKTLSRNVSVLFKALLLVKHMPSHKVTFGDSTFSCMASGSYPSPVGLLYLNCYNNECY